MLTQIYKKYYPAKKADNIITIRKKVFQAVILRLVTSKLLQTIFLSVFYQCFPKCQVAQFPLTSKGLICSSDQDRHELK